MLLGLVLLLLTLVVRGATRRNRHIGGRLAVSAACFGLYAGGVAAIRYAALSPDLAEELGPFLPLLPAFGVINLVVATAVNPWREHRLPDRFPTIVQDAIAVLLFMVVATVMLRDRFLAMTAAGAVVLGFALQDTLGNLISGLAIQIEKPFRVGHWIRMGDRDGQVMEVTWRATKMRTKAGNFVIVPNSNVAKETITNYSEPTPQTRIELQVGVSYDAPPNEVRAAILEAIRDIPWIISDPKPEVLVADFAAYSINYLVWVWTTDFGEDEKLRDHIRTAMFYEFRRRGISIPYPIQVEFQREWVEPSVDRGAMDDSMRRAAIFASLGDDQRAALAATARPNLYGAGEAIVRQGEAGSSMFVIARGEAVVTLSGSADPVARLRPGDFFGEMSLLTGDPRTATVSASSDCEVVEITAEGFRGVVMAQPAIAEQICTAVEKRRAELEQHRTAHSGPERASEPAVSLLSRMRHFLRLSGH